MDDVTNETKSEKCWICEKSFLETTEKYATIVTWPENIEERRTITVIYNCAWNWAVRLSQLCSIISEDTILISSCRP